MIMQEGQEPASSLYRVWDKPEWKWKWKWKKEGGEKENNKINESIPAIPGWN
jgi:hypothetical protein